VTAPALGSRRHAVRDLADAIEYCQAQGWTDGLPVVPPTADSVGAMLEAAGLDPGREIAHVAHRAVSITAEKVAINAVMAGCKPEYLPVVVAAIEGLGDPSPGGSMSTAETTSSGRAGAPTSPSAAPSASSCGTSAARVRAPSTAPRSAIRAASPT
jgi:hypothetical protein